MKLIYTQNNMLSETVGRVYSSTDGGFNCEITQHGAKRDGLDAGSETLDQAVDYVKNTIYDLAIEAENLG